LKPTIQALVGGSLMAMCLANAASADPYNNGLAAAGAHDYATAVQLWRPLADEGLANAQDSLGILYENGMGVVQDHAAAAALFHKAGALYSLGDIYANGHTIQRDPVQAYLWLSVAAVRLAPNDTMRPAAIRGRDLAARAMTEAQLDQAEKQLNDWPPK